jgi:hypothetical protein
MKLFGFFAMFVAAVSAQDVIGDHPGEIYKEQFEQVSNQTEQTSTQVEQESDQIEQESNQTWNHTQTEP